MKNNPPPTHETTDTPTRPALDHRGRDCAGGSCTVIALMVTMMFNNLKRRSRSMPTRTPRKRRDVIPSVAASKEQFPAPRLQLAPEADLAALRAREDEVLNQYGWVDKKAGVVRIPIERAMDLIAQRGLPVNGQPGAPAPYRTTQDLLQQVKTLEKETPTPSPAPFLTPLKIK